MTNYRESLPIADKSISIIIVSPSPRYIVYLASIIDNSLRKNIKVKIINFSSLDNPSLYSFTNYMNNRKSSSMINFLISKFKSKNLELMEVNLKELKKLSNQRYKIKNWKSVLELDVYEGALSNSIASFFSTYRVKSERNLGKLAGIKKTTIKSIENFELIYKSLSQALPLGEKPKKIIFLNGRMPHEAAIRYFAEKNMIPFLVLEHGRPPDLNRFHLAPYQTNVGSEMARNLRIELEYELENNEESHLEKILSIAQIWLESNANDQKFNQFLTESNSTIDNCDDQKTAVIFTSSIGEYKSNKGLETNGWDSQLEAIVETSKYLKLHGYDVLVRIHPNAGNNSFYDLKNLINKLKENSIRFYSPWDDISSYNLLKQATVVFTWGSTIGLEASALGIPTYLFGRGYYDEVADIKFFTRDDLKHNLVSYLEPVLWEVDKSKALLAVYISKNNGYFIDKISESHNFKMFRVLFQKKYGQSNTLKRIILKKYHGELILIFFRIFRNAFYASPNDLRRIFKVFIGDKLAKSLIRTIFKF